MILFKRTIKRTFIIGLLIVGFILPIGLSGQAQSNALAIDNLLPEIWNPPEAWKPPVRTGDLPGNRQPGGVRGCNLRLTALAPDLEKDRAILTDSAYPSFFWHIVRFDNDDDWELQFSLEDQEGNQVYATEYKLAKPERNGFISEVMRLDLPAYAAFTPLERNQEYKWTIKPICNEQPLRIAYGHIYRVNDLSLQLRERLNQAPIQEKLAIYARNGFWPETLATLYDLGRSTPPDSPQLEPQLQQAWIKLLNSVGLNQVARDLSSIYAQSSIQRTTNQ